MKSLLKVIKNKQSKTKILIIPLVCVVVLSFLGNPNGKRTILKIALEKVGQDNS